jgi:glucose-1-phosphate thymidylyltransferase
MKKGVILCGGWGTRMRPATYTTNKHLLPIYTDDKAIPMIEYPIGILQKLQITDVLIITSREHCGIVSEYLGDGFPRGMTFTYKIQEMSDPKRPPGIASALSLSKDFTMNENFIVLLGDNYFQWNDDFYFFVKNFDNKTNKCGLFLYKTEDWKRFGIAELENGKIKKIVEKPKEFISNYCVTGMYLYTKDVYSRIKKLIPSLRGELEITDINDSYCKEGTADHVLFDTFWSDMGTANSICKTIEFLNKKDE